MLSTRNIAFAMHDQVILLQLLLMQNTSSWRRHSAFQIEECYSICRVILTIDM